MFIAAQFTIAKMWNQPNCPSVNKWIKKLWCIYTYHGILLSQERNNGIHSNLDGFGDHYSK
uniref:Alternative protein NFX1 n=1 Tax=Homo sapiens TaxID=9606 RepID=L8ECM9_HUMAN|nr:alternative protein NFX1 [Homo sapiens]